VNAVVGGWTETAACSPETTTETVLIERKARVRLVSLSFPLRGRI